MFHVRQLIRLSSGKLYRFGHHLVSDTTRSHRRSFSTYGNRMSQSRHSRRTFRSALTERIRFACGVRTGVFSMRSPIDRIARSTGARRSHRGRAPETDAPSRR